MAIDSTKGVKINYLIVLLSGLLLLGGSFLIYLLILQGLYGNFEISEIYPTKENLAFLFGEDKKPAAILYSGYTEKNLPEGSTWLSDNTDAWERFLNTAKTKYDILDDLDIEEGKHFNYQLLILPGTRYVSDKQLVEIKKFLNEGGSVFATGGTATFSDEGKWRGWEFFNKVFGLNFSKEIKPEESFKLHTLRGNIPITAGIPTGFELKIATWDIPIAAEVLEPRTIQVSTWYDLEKDIGLVREEVQKSAGVAYGTYGKGRFAWFGFELNSVIGDQEDYVNFGNLFNNIMGYLRYLPVVFVKDWPSPFEAAAIFIADLTNQLENVNNLTPLLGRANYPVTFIVDPDAAIENKNLMKQLSRFGEIGVGLTLGNPDVELDSLGKLLDRTNQSNKVKFAKDTVSAIIGKPVLGLKSENKFLSENTLLAAGDSYIDFILIDSTMNRSVPEIVFRNSHPIVMIGRTGRDDRDVIGKFGLTNLDFQEYTYEEDIDRLLFEGGLYIFNTSSEYQLQAGNVEVVQRIFNYLNQNNIWVTSLKELREWWIRRGRIEIKYDIRSARRMSIEVTNPSDYRIDDFVVLVDLNKSVENIAISSDIVNMKIPKLEYKDKRTLNLIFESLEPGETRSLFIDFDNLDL